MAAAERAVQLVPRTAPAYAACPDWCADHVDDRRGFRTHTGIERRVAGRSPAGARVVMMLWSEMRDDGKGATTQVYLVEVGGVLIEMGVGQAHAFLKAVEKTVWRLDDRGVMYPSRRLDRAVSRDVTDDGDKAPADPRHNRGGRA